MSDPATPYLLALYEPDIAQNAGAIMRTCACLGVEAAVIEPAGFRMADSRFRRAGMDYLSGVRIASHDSWAKFEAWRIAAQRRLVLLTTSGEINLWDFAFALDDVILVGRESAGVPKTVRAAADARVRIPIRPPLRSLNVGVAAAIALAEALRQNGRLPHETREIEDCCLLCDEDVTLMIGWAIVARTRVAAEDTMSEFEKVRVLIADDHPLVVGGLREAVLAATPGAEIAVAHDFDSMASALESTPETDLVLLDLTMPGVRGFSGLLFLRSERPSTPVIVVSGNEDRAVIRHCLEFGAAGFIPKSTALETMRIAIVQVLDGGRWTPADFDPNAQPNKESSALARRLASLTPQQIRVLMMLSQGLLNKQIAYELSVSEATVKAHVSAILQKLGVESRTQAVILATKIESAQELSIAS